MKELPHLVTNDDDPSSDEDSNEVIPEQKEYFLRTEPPEQPNHFYILVTCFMHKNKLNS